MTLHQILYRIFESSTVAKICTVVLTVQVLLLILLYTIHCVISAVEAIAAPIRKRRNELFKRSIDRLLLDTINEGGTNKPFSLPQYYWFEREAIRDIIFSYLIELKGDAKMQLFHLYEEMGFFTIDVKKLSSKRWWKRLNGAIRLQHIGLAKSDKALMSLLNDPYPFIAKFINHHVDQTKKSSKIPWQGSF